MQQYSGLLQFRIDPLFSAELRRSLDSVLNLMKESERSESLFAPKSENKLTVDFVSESSLHTLKAGPEFRICLLDSNQGLFSFGQNIDERQCSGGRRLPVAVRGMRHDSPQLNSAIVFVS